MRQPLVGSMSWRHSSCSAAARSPNVQRTSVRASLRWDSAVTNSNRPFAHSSKRCLTSGFVARGIGRDLSQRYLATLRRFYNDQGITIDPLFAEQWMTYPSMFDSRHILPEWAVAMGVGAALVGGIEARDQRAIATIVAPLDKVGSFTSYDLAHDAGIEIDGDAMYQSIVRKMNADMDLLEKEAPDR
jgi:hypothetical protein